MSYDLSGWQQALNSLLEKGTPFVVVTLVDVRGSAPQIVGAKAIVTQQGIHWGTVGGGKVEAAAIDHAQQLLNQPTDSAQLVVWNLQTDIGMTCGGEVKLFFEVHTRTAWPIVIYGAGHVVQALIPILLQLECHVTCIDPRPQWLERLPPSPKLKIVVSADPHTTVADQPANAFFVLMSQGHATDLPVLAEILTNRQAAYIGVIGSRQKASVLRRELKARQLPPEKIDSFHCPIGLPIGNNTPAEIAISVAAQLLQQRDASHAAAAETPDKTAD